MIKKRVFVLLVLYIIALPLIFSETINPSDTPTHLNVGNTPPILVHEIPDIFLRVNESKENAINLTYHFIDPNGLPMTFSHSNPENITITIDQLTGLVSLYPDADFLGDIYVTFYATDTENQTTPSNNVTIFVGTDFEAPKWFSPRTNRQTIYQSSRVNFTTTWTDNVQLAGYIFSINQGTGWTNLTPVEFSGTQNISLDSFQISAPAKTLIQWVFYAWDTNDNYNVTDIQTFNVSEYPTYDAQQPPQTQRPPGAPPSAPASRREISPYIVDTDRIRVVVKQGSTISRTIRITSQSDSILEFNILMQGLYGMVVLSDETFSLNPGETKPITLDISATMNHSVDEYFGAIIIRAGEETMIPLVVEVSAFDPEIQINLDLDEKSKIVRPGRPVSANVTILSVKDLRDFEGVLSYALKDFSGNILDAGKKEVSFFDKYEDQIILTVPQEIPEGEYLFYAKITTGDLIALDSEIFEVSTGFKFFAFVISFGYILLALILLALLLILLILYKRAKERRRLLELYLMINELKELVKNGELESALNIYLRIKNKYGQPVSEEMMKNKTKLKEELKKFAENIKSTEDIKEVAEKTAGEKPDEEKSEKNKISAGNPEEKKSQPKTTEEKSKIIQPKPEEKPKDEKPIEPKTEENKNSKEIPLKKTEEKPKIIQPKIEDKTKEEGPNKKPEEKPKEPPKENKEKPKETPKK